MSAPSGWYDDPQDPTHLRYWDGVLWTCLLYTSDAADE